MPTTKEEVLRLFIAEHERAAEKIEALRDMLFGLHTEVLTALAVEATASANTAISDSRARAVVKHAEDRLSGAGQITATPQPAAVLDILVSQHTLVRSGAEAGALSFQHQQFQEWYASFEVERAIRGTAAGDEAAGHRLRIDMLDQPAWEEAILFACERVSRADQTGVEAVAVAVMLALSIDPMLAAEMIYRAVPAVWDRVRERVTAFVGRWHVPGTVDRAARFMIMSGRAEFAAQVWPLIANPDAQVPLSALRTARRFRPSVLGADVAARVAALPDDTRENVLSEIVMQGGIDGIELVTDIAKTDPSADVQLAVVQALQFRKADGHVGELLAVVSPRVWPLLVQKGYADEIADPAAADRLRVERQRLIAGEANPLSRMGLLLEFASSTASDGEQIATAIEEADFPAQDQHAALRVHEAFKRYPEQVAAALIRRMEAGRELPFHAEELVARVMAIDEGPIPAAAMDTSARNQLGHVAASVVGPETAGLLIDAFVALADRMASASGRVDTATGEHYHLLRDRIAVTRASSFLAALLSRGQTDQPHRIGLLAALVARHGTDELRKECLAVDGGLAGGLIALFHRWVETLLASPDSKRHQFAEVGTAIGRLGRLELVPDLKRLLDTDLSRWRQARPLRQAAPARLTVEQQSDAAHSWTLQCRQAFAGIGGDQVVRLMGEYLEDDDFGFDAACVLRAVWDREQNTPKLTWSKSWPDFSDVKTRRAQRRAAGTPRPASPLAEMIFAAIERLIQPGGGDNKQRLAIMLGRIALSMPHGDKSAVINALVALPQPVRTKRELLAALVLDGEIIRADLVMEGVQAWLDDARQNTWRFREGLWEVEGWLELLPFTDRPAATIEGVELVNSALPDPHRMERVVSALGDAPDEEAERMLSQLVCRHPRLVSQHEWVKAILKRDTVSAATILIDLVFDGGLASGPGAADTWWLSRELTALVRRHSELRSEVLRRYQNVADGTGRNLIERVVAELGDADGVLAMVRAYARSARRFDGLLDKAIRDAALSQRPAIGWAGAYELHPVALAALRKELFGMLPGGAHAAALAGACLTAIDELRDEYGATEFEPRHPDVETGRPWPSAAG